MTQRQDQGAASADSPLTSQDESRPYVCHPESNGYGGFGHPSRWAGDCLACHHGYVGPCRGYYVTLNQQVPCGCQEDTDA